MPCPFLHPAGSAGSGSAGAAPPAISESGGTPPELCAARIAALDPLRADEALSHLPEWNRRSDVCALAAALRSLLPREANGSSSLFEPEAACAAMRDLGMFLSSIRRFGVEPLALVPEAEPILRGLGRLVGLVPRDTVFHYGPWNPEGARERLFTGDDNERGLIHCVRTSVPGIEAALSVLLGFDRVPIESALFLSLCEEGARRISTLVDVIQYAREHVDPIFFAEVLRPYFEPIRVDGRSYQGPAAAHIPLFLIDHLVWASDSTDPEIRALHDDTAQYALPRWRALYRGRLGAAPLVRRALTVLASLPPADREARAAALTAMFRPLVVFRGRHLAIANQAYAPGVRKFPVGSGGYAVSTLSHLLQAMRARIGPLAALGDSRPGKHGEHERHA